MLSIASVILVIAIILKFFASRKPNNYWGYQLGSVKKSIEHWKIANRYASLYIIVIYGLILALALFLNTKSMMKRSCFIGLFGIGIIILYFGVEERLDKIGNANASNSS